MNPECALYRFFGEGGELLYVGITVRPSYRFRQHARKPWWQSVDRIEVEWFDFRHQAEDAEQGEIWQNHPRYNLSNPIVEQNRPRKGPRAGGTVALGEAIGLAVPGTPPSWISDCARNDQG